MVEFAVIMPTRGDKEHRPPLLIDANFPDEAYARLLAASVAGDEEGDRAAGRG